MRATVVDMLALDVVRVGLLAVLLVTTSVVVVQVTHKEQPTIVIVRAAGAPVNVTVPACRYWYSGTPWSVDVNPYCGYWRD